ncbi:arylsulfatase A-like enzyme [Lewinella marina]|uniref:Arylsulfatase n=1 Tax=Neolewinella marina TaxID=438751 RepID=A0A2G0CDH7_9BACT|nr:arylsulfatase [Neolewinella marina]NJB86055.1 arylsulfatase A-like enzyme [Neolewinella marina]PHK97980.1 arylsulfatase [Neolewinella marina]
MTLLQHVCLATLILMLGMGCGRDGGPSAAAANKPQRPNIIFILADDLGYGDLSSYGQQHFSTPNIDRLAARGMRFTQHYSGATVCAPSRSALMTGQHTGHTFIRGNHEIKPEGQYPLPDSIFTLAESLQQAAYVTGAFGKWGLGFPGSEGDPVFQGFNEFMGYNCQRLGHNYYPRHLWHNRDTIALPQNAGEMEGSYAPDLIHDQTMAFLEDHADTSFFLFVPSIIPHAELIAPDSILARFRGQIEESEPYEGAEPGDEAYREGPYSSQETPHAAFVAMMDILDRQVGEITRKVEELGIAENTIIIFTSDNGPHREGGADPDFFDSNGPLRGYKRDLYEGGIRVPMIAVWPGHIAAGVDNDHVSAFWDFFPTFSELTGAPRPLQTDGISMVPTLLGEGEQPQHEQLYWEFHERNGRQAIRSGKWKAVRYNVNEMGMDGPVELYDLSVDPGETTDLASQHPEVVADMKERLREARYPSSVFTFAQEAYQGK